MSTELEIKTSTHSPAVLSINRSVEGRAFSVPEESKVETQSTEYVSQPDVGAISTSNLQINDEPRLPDHSPVVRQQKFLPSKVPTVRYAKSMRPHLAGVVGSLVLGVEGIIRHSVQLANVEVSNISLTLRESYETPRNELKFTVHTTANPEQGFALWDTIGLGIEDWRRRLSPLPKRILDERIGISVEWSEEDAG